MAATVTVNNAGRVAIANVAVVSITVGANSVSYATSSGGLAFDLTTALNAISPPDHVPNPSDIIGIIPIGLSTNGYLPTGFTLGTPTYSAVTGAAAGLPGLGTLATCPCFVRLIGTGSGAAAALANVADGTNTDSFTALLVIGRGGHN